MFFGARFRSRRCGSKPPLADSVTSRDVLAGAKDAPGVAWRDCGERLPPEGEASFDVMFQGKGLEIPSDSRWVRAASAALAAEYSRAPILMGSGASIPVVEMLKDTLGLDSLLVGFGLDDDQVHSPNEKFEMTCFHRGQRSYVRLLAEIAASR